MKLLSDLFAKYKNLEPKDRSVKRAVVAAFKEVFGRELNPSTISVQRNTVFIQGPGPLKQEIVLRQEALLSSVNAAVAPKRIEKIL